jgi:predicted DNA-binding WGR domain protein
MSCQLLHRIDTDLNMARFYRVELLPDLFGAIIVERRWGRIGGRGQSRTASYPSIPVADAAAKEQVRLKERRGYRVTSLSQPSIA